MLVIRFNARPNCLGLVRGSLSRLQDYRNLEVSVDGQPFRAALNNATVPSIRRWALEKGMYVDSIKETVRGSYRVTFKSHDEARLEAAEAEGVHEALLALINEINRCRIKYGGPNWTPSVRSGHFSGGTND